MKRFKSFWNSLVRRKEQSVCANSEPTMTHNDVLTELQKEPQLAPTSRQWGNPVEVVPGLYRKCDLCPFVVRSEFPEVINWALNDHMYRDHPTKGKRV